jgi:hypothetical protein
MICSSDKDTDVGLCYTKCKAGFKGIGPVCWGSCPTPPTIEECGALCISGGGDCSGYVMKVVGQVADLVASVAKTAAGDIDIGGIIKGSTDIA